MSDTTPTVGPFTVPMTFANADAFIAGRTTAEVTLQLAQLDGDALPSDIRRAIMAALIARKARKDAARTAIAAA